MITFLVLGYLVAAVVFFGDSGQDELCRDLTVHLQNSDVRFISEAHIVAILKQNNIHPVGRRMKAVNTDRIEKVLLKNEVLERVDAYKTPSGTVRVDVKQKTPVMRVMSSPEGSFYIDSKGSLMPVSRHCTVHVPVASGYITKELATAGLYEFALFLKENEFWNSQIEQIYVHPDKEVELTPRVGEHRILLGTLDGFREKLDNLLLFYEQAIPKTGWDKYSMINLKFKNQIVCTKK
jgi:cell division protein FtsQ